MPFEGEGEGQIKSKLIRYHYAGVMITEITRMFLRLWNVRHKLKMVRTIRQIIGYKY